MAGDQNNDRHRDDLFNLPAGPSHQELPVLLDDDEIELNLLVTAAPQGRGRRGRGNRQNFFIRSFNPLGHPPPSFSRASEVLRNSRMTRSATTKSANEALAKRPKFNFEEEESDYNEHMANCRRSLQPANKKCKYGRPRPPLPKGKFSQRGKGTGKKSKEPPKKKEENVNLVPCEVLKPKRSSCRGAARSTPEAKSTDTSEKDEPEPSTSYDGLHESPEEVLEDCIKEKVESCASGSNNEINEIDFVIRDEKYYYGLFGITRKCEEEEETMGSNYLVNLPASILEEILCHTPFLDLLNLRLVCKSWNDIIKRPTFMMWKKAYYHYKYADASDDCFGEATREYIREHRVGSCFPGLMKFMIEGYKRRPPPDMMPLMRSLPQYGIAKDVLAERFSELDVRSPWGFMTMFVLLSKSVEDVETMFRRLIRSGSRTSICDILDAMYCLALFFLYFIRNFRINHGFHFRLYQVIYNFENGTPSSGPVKRGKLGAKLSGQQSILKYCEPEKEKLTYEQVRILNHRLMPKQVVKIIAFAGTGKTSTLVHFTRLYPQLKFLSVVYNKSVPSSHSAENYDQKYQTASSHNTKLFPPNVECRTVHSLAYQAIGKHYRHKLRFKVKPHDLVPFIKKPKDLKQLHVFTYAKLVLETIESFTCGSDEEMKLAHVPSKVHSRPGRFATQFVLAEPLNMTTRQSILNEANEIWLKMSDTKNRDVGITHDTYLKFYQLSHPVYTGYDCILVDEAQDTNTAILDVILSQEMPVILVGDPNQQIYSFRGAKNSLQSVNATHTYHLTKSFRFGPEIGYLGSCCLEVLKCNLRDTMVASDKIARIDGTISGQYAIVARTNLQLFEEAVRLCCSDQRRNDEPAVIQGCFIGGIAGYGLDQLVDIHNLLTRQNPDNIKDKFIKKFDSFDALYTYAKKADDTDLHGKIELVMQKRATIIQSVKTIKSKCRYSMELANIIFTTAHKSKGLEFDTVSITSDYNVGNIPDSTYNEEYNILYVALTRAKKCLVISDTLYKVLLTSQEKFEYPVLSQEVLKDRASIECVGCSANFTPRTVLVLCRQNISMASGQKVNGGPLCMKCGSSPRFRPAVFYGPAVMFLDYLEDTYHRSMSCLVGPLPGDPPMEHEELQLEERGAQIPAQGGELRMIIRLER